MYFALNLILIGGFILGTQVRATFTFWKKYLYILWSSYSGIDFYNNQLSTGSQGARLSDTQWRTLWGLQVIITITITIQVSITRTSQLKKLKKSFRFKYRLEVWNMVLHFTFYTKLFQVEKSTQNAWILPRMWQRQNGKAVWTETNSLWIM